MSRSSDDPVPQWVLDHPILSPGEERRLGLIVRDRPGTPEAIAAGKELVRCNARFAMRVAGRIGRQYRLSAADAFSLAMIGLCEFSPRFDPDKGRFCTLGRYYIVKAVGIGWPAEKLTIRCGLGSLNYANRIEKMSEFDRGDRQRTILARRDAATAGVRSIASGRYSPPVVDRSATSEDVEAIREHEAELAEMRSMFASAVDQAGLTEREAAALSGTVFPGMSVSNYGSTRDSAKRKIRSALDRMVRGVNLERTKSR